MSDETTDAVRPDEGEGGGGEGNPLYAEYLDRIPEESRGVAEEAFKAFDANTTKRFQEAAEYKQQWQPYEEAGINSIDPELAKWAVQFANSLDNPDAIHEWFRDVYAPQYGIDLNPQQQQQQDQFAGGEFEYEDPTAKLQQQIEQLQQQIEGHTSWQQQQEQQAAVAEAHKFIQGQMDEIASKNPAEFDDTAREYVEVFAGRYIDSDPRNAVPKAWKDYQALRNTLSKQALQEKVDQGTGAESGGVPDGAPDEVKDLKQAGELAKQWLRSSGFSA
jgi:hypothetical protein